MSSLQESYLTFTRLAIPYIGFIHAAVATQDCYPTVLKDGRRSTPLVLPQGVVSEPHRIHIPEMDVGEDFNISVSDHKCDRKVASLTNAGFLIAFVEEGCSQAAALQAIKDWTLRN